jgi:sulfite oxidase
VCRPWCGEPRLSRLAEHFYTPNELFYVRNHLPVPVIDADEWELTVRGNGVTERRFTLNDLKTKFQKHEVVSTLQCAGNRREDMHAIEQPDGEAQVFISPHWVSGAVSNAKWGGVRLRDVLRECGVDVDAMALDNKKDPLQRHVQWSSYDADETGNNYGSSIPIEKAIDPRGDVLLAWEMNGEPLPRDHGFPVRALVPGHAGARQAKWLAEVIIAEEESPRHWQQKAYRGFAPDVRFQKGLYKWKDIRLDQAPIVQEMPVQSLICHPENNSSIPGKNSDGSVVDSVKIRGVAWSGGGAGIARVDVSTDGGPNFSAAELYTPIEQEWRRKWAWYLFEKEFPLTEEQKRKIASGEKIELECVSKAADGAFNVQPERPEPYYNARGVAINNWYRVRVTIDPKIAMETSDPNAQFGNTPTSGTFHQPWQGHGWTGAERNEHEKK